MTEAAADIGRAAHLPEQPGQALGACGALLGQELAEFLSEVHQDRTGLEDADRFRAAAVHHRRDLRVRIDLDEAAAELVALADADQPGVVFGALVALREQFFEHDRDLDAVRRALRVELQRMLADRQFLLLLRAGRRAIDVGEAAHCAVGLVPGPDLGRRVFGHRETPGCGTTSAIAEVVRDGVTERRYCAAARSGRCDFRKVRTFWIMRCRSSSGSRHGKTVISEFGASEATSIEVCSGCDGVSSGSTRIGVRQLLMKSRDTLYRKSGCARHRLWKYLSIVSCDTSGRRFLKSGSQLSVLCRYMTPGSSGRSPTVWWKTAATTRSGARCNSLPAKQPPMQ